MSLLPVRYQATPIVRLTAGQRRQLWDSLLDADMSARYWRHLARCYSRYDMILRAAVLCISSGAVMSLLLWLELGWVLRVLTVLTACLSAISLVSNIASRTETMMDLAGKWTALMNAHENLWHVVDTGYPETVLTRYGELQTSEVELIRAECRLPFSERLVKRAYDEVCRSRGLASSL